jgi:hypothetical protein
MDLDGDGVDELKVYNFGDCDEREKLEAHGFRWGCCGQVEGV